MTRVGVFVQARMGSTRFPGKVIAPLKGKPLLEWVVEALKGVPSDVRAILTDLESLSALNPIGVKYGWEVFAGHPTDVMKRFIDAGDYYGVDTIVRATGDNPLVDTAIATWLLGIHLRCDGEATQALGGRVGTLVEVVNLQALKWVYGGASPRDREHVMPAIYGSSLPVNKVWVKGGYDESVTIDTPEDLQRVEGILDGQA